MMLGAVVPPGSMEHFLKFSVQYMQKLPKYHLTPEQAQKYGALSKELMMGLQSMRILIGVAEPGAGFYGNTTIVMTVDDSKRFLDNYEQMLGKIRAFAQEVKSAAIPVATSQRVKLDDTEALEITMDLSRMSPFTPPGGPNPEKMMEAMLGPNGKMKLYVAPADEHAVVTSYVSLERLKSAIELFQSKQPGLSADAGVAKTAAALPPGSQAVAYVSVDGFSNASRQFMKALPGRRRYRFPTFPRVRQSEWP